MRKATLTLVVASVALFAACSDNSIGPRGQTADASPMVGGVTAALTSTDTTAFDIVIDPSRVSTFYLGSGNYLVFPAHSVCDPNKSTYGEGEWDKPCSAASRTVTEHVKAWLDKDGHPRTDFDPDLRFVPSDLTTQWVNITFADFQASLDPKFSILYCRQDDGGGRGGRGGGRGGSQASCTDESKKDATLLTVRNAVTGKVTRRIKHFSGYMVGAGDDSMGDPSSFNKIGVGTQLPTSSKVPSETATAASGRRGRSGYMLASGRSGR